jgi:hypothetical protein
MAYRELNVLSAGKERDVFGMHADITPGGKY